MRAPNKSGTSIMHLDVKKLKNHPSLNIRKVVKNKSKISFLRFNF